MADGGADDLRAVVLFGRPLLTQRQVHFANSSLVGLRQLPDISVVRYIPFCFDINLTWHCRSFSCRLGVLRQFTAVWDQI
jgi:hypothetical protein